MLDKLDSKDRDLLISMPYRVGIWISHADDVGGDQDDDRERARLESYLKAVAKMLDIPALVRESAQAAIECKDDWPAWEAREMQVIDDCARVHELLENHFPERQRKSYKTFLYRIAERVAGSYGEFGGFDEEDMGFIGKISSFFKAMRPKEEQAFVNISPTEESALQTLGTALYLKKSAMRP